MVGRPVFLRIAVVHSPRSDIHLEADDGLDPFFDAGATKVDDAVHDAVIGEGNGRHVQLLCPPGKVLDTAQAVEERELAVDVQMDEIRHQTVPPTGDKWNEANACKCTEEIIPSKTAGFKQKAVRSASPKSMSTCFECVRSSQVCTISTTGSTLKTGGRSAVRLAVRPCSATAILARGFRLPWTSLGLSQSV